VPATGRRLVESTRDARCGYLTKTPPRPLPYGTPIHKRRSFQGRYVIPALDLDEPGRALIRRARAGAAVAVHYCAARNERELDSAAHAELLEQWTWTLATRG
jgi:hypothetical protein